MLTAAGYRSVLEAQRDGWHDLLARLVNIDSGPGMLDGCAAVSGIVAGELARLGFAVGATETRDDAPPVLIAHRPAVAVGAPRLLLLWHLDTVFGRGTAADRPFQIRAGLATGPGVADMKGGVVSALAALSCLTSHVLDGLDVTVLASGDEESGSIASRPVIEDAARMADLVLVFEPARPNGSIVIGRRGVQRYWLHVEGKAAHSGVNPEDGANAIEAASHHVLRLQDFRDRWPDTSVTVTRIEGGSNPNVVPDTAAVFVDCRVPSAEVAQAVQSAVETVAGTVVVPGTRTRVVPVVERPPMAADDAVRAMLPFFLAAGDELGIQLSPCATGGSSDGNFTSALGVPTIDGLGPVGGGYHSADEFVRLDSIVERAAVVAGALTTIATHGLPTAVAER